MTRRDRARGLTRTDVLVVLGLGVFLLAVGVLLASEPRAQARRVVCRANLGKIGKAMFVYAGDYDGALPRAGGPTSTWGLLGNNWSAPDRYTAYGVTPGTGEGGKASISSCFYLLVKYLDMPPAVFVCPSDVGTSPFRLADEDLSGLPRLRDAWDFGLDPGDNCSYTCHLPFSMYALNQASDPNMAVAADRNPWIKSPAAEVDVTRYSLFIPDFPPYNGTIETARRGNAISHEEDGQNVLFLDGRVTFERRAHCGPEHDNIYTRSTIIGRGDPMGEWHCRA